MLRVGDFRFDHIFGDAFGDIPGPFEIAIDLEDRQQEAKVDGDRAEQRKNILTIPVDLQLVAIDPFLFQHHFPGEVLIEIQKGQPGFIQLGIDQRPHIDDFGFQQL